MDFLTKGFAKFLGNVLTGIVDSVLTGIANTFQTLMKKYVTHGSIVAAHNTVLGVSISIIALFCVKQYFSVYVMEDFGDPDADPLDILVRGSEATAIASCSSWFFYTFMNFCSSFATDILEGQGETDFMITFQSVLESLLMNVTGKGFIWLIFLGAMLIGIIVFYVIAVLRALQLALMYIVLPLFCTELCFSSHERLSGLVTNIAVTGLYFSLQLLLFSIFLVQFASTLTGITADASMTSGTYTTIGFLIAMLRSPKWLDKFVYNSGVKDSALGALRLAIMTGGRKWK